MSDKIQTKQLEPLENTLSCWVSDSTGSAILNDYFRSRNWHPLAKAQQKVDESLLKVEREKSWFYNGYLHDYSEHKIDFIRILFQQGDYQRSQKTAFKLVMDLKAHQEKGLKCTDSDHDGLMLSALSHLLNSAFCNNDAGMVLYAYAKTKSDFGSQFSSVDNAKVGFAYYLLNNFKKAIKLLEAESTIAPDSDSVRLERKYNLAVAYAADNRMWMSNNILLDLTRRLLLSDELLTIQDYLKEHPTKIVHSYDEQYCKWRDNLCEPDKRTAQDIYKNVLDSSNNLEKRALLYSFINSYISHPKDADGKEVVTKPEIALARHSLLVKSEYLLAKNYERVGDPFASLHYYNVRKFDPGFRTQEILDKIKKYQAK